MGYTHYYTQTRDYTDKEWQEVKSFAAQFLKRGSLNLIIDCKYDQKFKINDKLIFFNGIKDDGHETFCLGKKIKPTTWESAGGCFKKGEQFQFCKTAYKPYDQYVVAFLCGVNVIAPGALHITSDGWYHEWLDGLNLAKAYFPKLKSLKIPKTIEKKRKGG